ncbi:glucosaminidase domain-containing protein [Enterococcus pallens]|uniref:Mannosyl-glycoprotein endo-beta-N-acetylglucosamidase-like domain-containing protein n=1 Tax=Enterococcus pallens ATCC BAA-351 TaxID=1158607 RepID=R2SBS5_9ENTE|nr:glucosaminidase domain-containing protein [Enterococcus pallens]EOH90301.1 hypothetical protein UAU_04130 [Enterococcus pallens ATCC BAA-351]EOU15093.1 hypothetical protein I588_04025 [Enterococcus pallens ATCC BAA-351]
MKGKLLLSSLVITGFFIVGTQAQVKQLVSAETNEVASSIQEAPLKSTDTSIVTNETIAERSKESESSSMEETRNSQTQETTHLTTESTVKEEAASVTEKPKEAEMPSTIQTPLPPAKVEENYQFSVTKNQTTEEFIQTIGKDAQAIAWNEDLYASVMIAQAILETGSGNSQLARPPYHNLFGIKGSYRGKQVSFNTQEDKGSGELYTIQSAFRQYPSYKESLEDYAALLKKGLSGNAGFYQGTWRSASATYQEAAKSLTGKYATDTAYDKKLIALIEAYDLTTYDQDPATIAEAEQEQPADASSNSDKYSEEKKTIEESSNSSEQELHVNQTKQPVIVVPPAAQRPAKQLAGNRIVQ